MTFEEFQATRVEMSARTFGALVGDRAWEDDESTRFLVYGSRWYIEICADGRHLLTIENCGWITGEDGSLEDLERELWSWALIA